MTPDATCNYSLSVNRINDQDAFVRTDQAYYLAWDGIDTWIISVVPGVSGSLSWERTDPNILGAYQPVGTATGVATVQLGEHP